MNWLLYLLEANSYIVVFFAFYKCLLHRETFYSLNRYFLLLSSGLSFLLPLLKLGNLNPEQKGPATMYYTGPSLKESMFSLESCLIFFYILIVLIGLIRLMLKLAQIYRLVASTEVDKIGKIYVVPSSQPLPFSFFNYLFISPNAEKRDTILRHEKVHIGQCHSADILYFELLAIINWFNPFVYLLRREIKAIHEFLADEQASREEAGLDEYALFLIRNSCATSRECLTSQMFNQSLLKKRIVMLSRKKSSPASYLKYSLILMVIPVMVCVSSMTLTKSYGIDLSTVNLQAWDTSKIKNEKHLVPAKSATKTKNDLPEQKVDQALSPAKNTQIPETSTKKEPSKVERVKYPASPKVAPGAPTPLKEAARMPSKKKLSASKGEPGKLPPPPKVAQPASPPAVEKVPPPPPPMVERAKYPATYKGAPGAIIPVEQTGKPVPKKKLPEPKEVEQVKLPPPPKEAKPPALLL